jgi:hypothetical protein
MISHERMEKEILPQFIGLRDRVARHATGLRTSWSFRLQPPYSRIMVWCQHAPTDFKSTLHVTLDDRLATLEVVGHDALPSEWEKHPHILAPDKRLVPPPRQSSEALWAEFESKVAQGLKLFEEHVAAAVAPSSVPDTVTACEKKVVATMIESRNWLRERARQLLQDREQKSRWGWDHFDMIESIVYSGGMEVPERKLGSTQQVLSMVGLRFSEGETLDRDHEPRHGGGVDVGMWRVDGKDVLRLSGSQPGSTRLAELYTVSFANVSDSKALTNLGGWTEWLLEDLKPRQTTGEAELTPEEIADLKAALEAPPASPPAHRPSGWERMRNFFRR